MITSLMMSLVVSLALTLIIELTISIILGVRKKEDIMVVICANVCTNPIVVFVANCLTLFNSNLIYNIRNYNFRNISCYS